jgi:hypothetical protein
MNFLDQKICRFLKDCVPAILLLKVPATRMPTVQPVSWRRVFFLRSPLQGARQINPLKRFKYRNRARCLVDHVGCQLRLGWPLKKIRLCARCCRLCAMSDCEVHVPAERKPGFFFAEEWKPLLSAAVPIMINSVLNSSIQIVNLIFAGELS